MNYLPNGGPSTSSKLITEPALIVYASNVLEEVIPENKKGKALLYFTHSHEAFEPITKAKNGKIMVSHQSENIMKIGEKLKAQLVFNGVETDVLPIDNAREMSKNGVLFSRAYKAIRPHIEKRIKEVKYDLIIDLHRDSIGPDRTTIVQGGEKYAKVAFVIGTEHPNFTRNEAMAKHLKNEMELLVPGITRSLIKKGGHGVDGKYNQDLHSSLILVELGGIGNSEDELNRTVAVIAKAAASVLENPARVEN